MPEDSGAEVGDLVAHLIRNACVNDGTAASGEEFRSASLLRSVLEGPGLDLASFEPTPGRMSLVARIEGHDRSAPSLALVGHTDVVPANPHRWRRDPFAGEVIDGEVWGRGAIDMLNLTASMAVAMRRLADAGFRPRGSLVFVAVADEEALGEHGAGFLTTHEWDAVGAEYVLTESGGIPVSTTAGSRLGVTVGEKGAMWCRLRVSGTAGHASRPLRTDNALVKAAEVVRRIATYRAPAVIDDAWRRYVRDMAYSPELADQLVDAGRIDELLEEIDDVGLARRAHASTHLTMAPTIMRAGTKTNVIPDVVELEVDIRALPGQTADTVHAVVLDALGDLAQEVDVVGFVDDPATISPVDTLLWAALERSAAALAPGARCIPTLTTGATDARFYRRRGAVAYGFGLFSGRYSLDEVGAMFHGDDERVDLASLALSTALWEHVAREAVG